MRKLIPFIIGAAMFMCGLLAIILFDGRHWLIETGLMALGLALVIPRARKGTAAAILLGLGTAMVGSVQGQIQDSAIMNERVPLTIGTQGTQGTQGRGRFLVPMVLTLEGQVPVTPPTPNFPPVPTNPPPDNILQRTWDAFHLNSSNIVYVVYATYSKQYDHHVGAGAGAFYPLTPTNSPVDVLTGPRIEWANGGFVGLSGTANIGVPWQPTSWLKLELFAYGGFMTGLSGSSIAGIHIPGSTITGTVPCDGYGGEVHLLHARIFSKPLDLGLFVYRETRYFTPSIDVWIAGLAGKIPLW